METLLFFVLGVGLGYLAKSLAVLCDSMTRAKFLDALHRLEKHL